MFPSPSTPQERKSLKRSVQFSPEFTAAVEAKQIAQQEAQRAAFVVDRARQEKQAMIVSAQGEAMSAELIGKAVQRNAAYVTLRRIETAKEIAKILAQGSNRLLLDADALLLNVKEQDKT
jgi:prohibitin 2